MLRLNVMADDAFRNDIMSMARGTLREAVPVALAEKLSQEGWLDKQFTAALERLDLVGRSFKWLQRADVWESREARNAIKSVAEIFLNKKVEEFRVEAAQIVRDKTDSFCVATASQINAFLDRAKALVEKEIPESRVRAIVAEELRKRLSGE